MIYFVSALAGAGKTHEAYRYAVTAADRTGQKFLFVQPSRILIDQTFADAQAFADETGADIQITRYYTQEDGTPVVARIVEHFKNADEGGEIVFITQKAFFMTPFFQNRGDWVLIVDEIPQVDRCWEFKLPRTHTLLTTALRVEDHDPLHYRVEIEDKQQLRLFQRNPDRDDIYALFSELADSVLSEHWSVYARKEHWVRYQQGKSEHGRHTLSIFAMLEPSVFYGFKQVIIMGAMFDQSLLSLYWSTRGVRFEPFNDIQDRVRYQSHDNGPLITFRYILDEDWSKRVRKADVGEMSLMDWAVDQVNDLFAGTDFIWVANNDVKDSTFPEGIRLPGVPNGLNEYQHIDNVVFLSALNRYPAHYAFLAHQGLDPEWVKVATGCQMSYQAMMRCSVRNPASTTQKTIVVPDKTTAEYLAAYFPGCGVGPLDGEVKVTKSKPGRKSLTGTALSPQQKKVRERAAKKRQMLADLLKLAEETAGHQTPYNSDSVTGDGQNPDLGKAWNTYTLNLFDSIYSPVPSMRLRLTTDELIGELRNCHRWAIESKTANALVAAADFDPTKAVETKRGIDNITHVNGVWLDNDGGDLIHEEFHRFFPDLRMVAFSTYSGGNRWRAFIPTTQVMTVDAHQLIIRTIVGVLKEKGYHSDRDAAKVEKATGRQVKLHGFDTSKFTACSLFYLPSQSKDGDGFFREWGGKELDPMKWIERSVVHDHAGPLNVIEYEGEEKAAANTNLPLPEWTGVDDCPFVSRKKLKEYMDLPPHTGARYHGLYGMAKSIKLRAQRYSYALSPPELKALLTEIDNKMGGYHQGQDRKRIPECVKNALRKAV